MAFMRWRLSGFVSVDGDRRVGVRTLFLCVGERRGTTLSVFFCGGERAFLNPKKREGTAYGFDISVRSSHCTFGVAFALLRTAARVSAFEKLRPNSDVGLSFACRSLSISFVLAESIRSGSFDCVPATICRSSELMFYERPDRESRAAFSPKPISFVSRRMGLTWAICSPLSVNKRGLHRVQTDRRGIRI